MDIHIKEKALPSIFHHVLIVEDDKELSDFVLRFLSGKGYKVSLAIDGFEGLAMARQLIPDLILLDLNLPKLNGYAVCRLLKFDDQFKHIPIIMWSWRESARDQKLGMEVGADFYLPKPFSLEDLDSAIESLLKPNDK